MAGEDVVADANTFAVAAISYWGSSSSKVAKQDLPQAFLRHRSSLAVRASGALHIACNIIREMLMIGPRICLPSAALLLAGCTSQANEGPSIDQFQSALEAE